MSIEDGHFRTDRKTLEPCCEDCARLIREHPAKARHIMELAVGMQGLPMGVGCKFCGATLEIVDRLGEAGQ